MDFVYGVVTIILTYMAEQCVGQGGKVRGCCWQVAACGSTVTSSNRIHCSSVQLTSNNPRHVPVTGVCTVMALVCYIVVAIIQLVQYLHATEMVSIWPYAHVYMQHSMVCGKG